MLMQIIGIFLIFTCICFRTVAGESVTNHPLGSSNNVGKWWEMKKTSHAIFDIHRNLKIYIRPHHSLDEANIHSCYDYALVDEEEIITNINSFCFPVTVVTGQDKCSPQSAMEYHLSKEAELGLINKNTTEYCQYGNSSSIIDYFESLPRKVLHGQLHYEACWMHEESLELRQILHLPNVVYLIDVCAELAAVQETNSTSTNGTSSGDISLTPHGGWWAVEPTNHSFFHALQGGNKMFLRTVDLDAAKVHSCYEYAELYPSGVIYRYNSFCYPAVVVTGHRKCATSAMYRLLTTYPGAVTNGIKTKENCLFLDKTRSITDYFDSLPHTVQAGEVIVDGCVHVSGNMALRRLLRKPNTFYLVSIASICQTLSMNVFIELNLILFTQFLVRDYADWVWSAYNYWCLPEYDGDSCPGSSHWVDADRHRRSPARRSPRRCYSRSPARKGRGNFAAI